MGFRTLQVTTCCLFGKADGDLVNLARFHGFCFDFVRIPGGSVCDNACVCVWCDSACSLAGTLP